MSVTGFVPAWLKQLAAFALATAAAAAAGLVARQLSHAVRTWWGFSLTGLVG
jgi:hypothetical protein